MNIISFFPALKTYHNLVNTSADDDTPVDRLSQCVVILSGGGFVTVTSTRVLDIWLSLGPLPS